MTMFRPLSMLAVSLTLAVLAVLLGSGDAQARIKCGSILGPGGSHVLDRDLTCAQVDKAGTDYPDRIGVLKVIGGATLNLNGHTVTCKPGYTGPYAKDAWGIVARDSTVKNGTVRGCRFGIVPSGSFVKGMTLDANDNGVWMREKEGSGGNVIIGNTAANNRAYGFYMQETRDEMLIDNIAQGNLVGFGFHDADVALIGNVALRNTTLGFQADGPGRLMGNRAEENGEGFSISHIGETAGNIASRNTGSGFVVYTSRPAMLSLIHDNVARGNGGDGFQLQLGNDGPPGTLSSNYAINNLGYGLHVVDVFGPVLAEPTVTITGNTVIRNAAGDLADVSDCRYVLWVANRFGTAAQSCIH